MWVVDGIDGTRAFTIGRAEWSTMIALVVRARPTAAMITSPGLDRRWWSRDASSAVLSVHGEESALSVSATDSVVEASIATWPPTADVSTEVRGLVGRLPDAVGDRGALRPSWGNQVPNGAMLVAEGRIDAFVFLGGQVWDHAAPAAVVAAAGGRFSGLDGTSSLSTGGGIYTNCRIHDQLVDLLTTGRR